MALLMASLDRIVFALDRAMVFGDKAKTRISTRVGGEALGKGVIVKCASHLVRLGLLA